MTVVVTSKDEIVVPRSVRRMAGFKAGDRLELKASGGVITILPKLPTADGEYTPDQRRIIDAQLDEAEKGPFFGPFETADEMIAHIKAQLRKRTAPVRRLPRRAETKKSKPSR